LNFIVNNTFHAGDEPEPQYTVAFDGATSFFSLVIDDEVDNDDANNGTRRLITTGTILVVVVAHGRNAETKRRICMTMPHKGVMTSNSVIKKKRNPSCVRVLKG
jgi:hypothetical protein